MHFPNAYGRCPDCVHRDPVCPLAIGYVSCPRDPTTVEVTASDVCLATVSDPAMISGPVKNGRALETDVGRGNVNDHATCVGLYR